MNRLLASWRRVRSETSEAGSDLFSDVLPTGSYARPEHVAFRFSVSKKNPGMLLVQGLKKDPNAYFSGLRSSTWQVDPNATHVFDLASVAVEYVAESSNMKDFKLTDNDIPFKKAPYLSGLGLQSLLEAVKGAVEKSGIAQSRTRSEFQYYNPGAPATSPAPSSPTLG